MGAPELNEQPGDVLSNEDLTQAAAGGLRWIAYARVAIELILLGSMVVLARLITPAQFGVFAVVLIVQELAVAIPGEGIGSAMVQRKTISKDHLQGGLMMSIGVGLVLAALTALIAIVAVRPLFDEQTALLMIGTTPAFLFGAIFAAPMAVLRRRLDFRRLSIIDLATSAMRALGTLALALIGLNAAALVFGNLAALGLGLVLALCFAPVPLPRWRPKAMRELLTYGGPASLATVAWAGFRNGDYVIIGAALGSALAGIYWRAYQLAVEYQRKVAIAMTQIAFPVLSRTAGMEEMLALRQRMVQLLAVVLFPLLALLFVLAPVVIPWLFGPAWEPAVVPTQILVVGGASTLVIDACGSALMAAGRARTLLGYGVAHFVVYIGAVLALVQLGLPAVAIGGAVVHTVFLGVAYIVLLRGQVRSPLRVLWHDLAPALVSCLGLIVVAGPLYLGLSGIGAPSFLCTAAVSLAGGAAYLATLRVLYPGPAGDLRRAIGRLLPSRPAWMPSRLRLRSADLLANPAPDSQR
jgi:PST family polysaccharide transporter